MKKTLHMPGETDVKTDVDGVFGPRLRNANGPGPVLLVCEHASAHIPNEFESLGLSQDDLKRHIAWDPGALETAINLSKRLNAPLVHSTVSRLIYDCNRPPEAESAIPVQSEATHVPGNANLSEPDRQLRVERFYTPFETLLSKVLDDRPDLSVLVTIHSFTPVYCGKTRSVEIGFLHDKDSRLADSLLQVAQGLKTERNAPYGPEDGVTHTLRRHAVPRGILNVMIEIRNDLIETPQQCAKMADVLDDWISRALALCAPASTDVRPK